MDNQDKKIVKLSIFGTTYTLKTDADEAYVKNIAETLDHQLSDIASKNPDLPSIKITILCLIELMDDLLKTKSKLNTIEQDYSDKTKELISKIDAQLSSFHLLSDKS
jgi:cell division protein ZapA